MAAHGAHHILVVDDNEAGRYAVARSLRHAGYTVSEAGTGAEALRQVAALMPDLVLLDVGLPDITGMEVCRRIKSLPETAATAVLQISAAAPDDRTRVASLEGGADGYIATPVEPNVLLATIRSLLRTRMAEKKVHDAALEWQATFDAIRDGVSLLDAAGEIQRSNAALGELLEIGPGEAEGRNIDELIPPAPGETPLKQILASLRRTSFEREFGERTFQITIDPLARSPEQISGGVAIVTDITERKRLDQQLRHSQKLESIGLLAGGVAHDFNNLLMGILGNASLAIESLHDPKMTRGLLRDVMRASERAAELTRQLLAYAGKGRFATEAVYLSNLIQELVPLIQSSIPRKVRLMLNLKGTIPPVQADKAQVEQLVMNLIINAGEAISDEAGTVVVTTSLRRVAPEELNAFLTENRDGGEFVVLQVRDTGSGMDEETLKRIFDPFFSTKFLGRGMGLSAALGIVRGHKGAIKVTTGPGRGTIFEVLFPAAVEIKPAEQDRPHEDPAMVPGSGTVLVVDDEEVVRTVLEQTLTRAGYEVLVAENGREALTVFARNAARIQLVLLDLVMPVMSGEEILPHLLTMKPGIPIIVSSGQSEDECMRKLREPRVAGFLQKPYRPASLSAKVHDVLGGNKKQVRKS